MTSHLHISIVPANRSHADQGRTAVPPATTRALHRCVTAWRLMGDDCAASVSPWQTAACVQKSSRFSLPRPWTDMLSFPLSHPIVYSLFTSRCVCVYKFILLYCATHWARCCVMFVTIFFCIGVVYCTVSLKGHTWLMYFWMSSRHIIRRECLGA